MLETLGPQILQHVRLEGLPGYASDGGFEVSKCWYEYEGKKIHFIAAHVVSKDLAEAIVALKPHIEAVPAQRRCGRRLLRVAPG